MITDTFLHLRISLRLPARHVAIAASLDVTLLLRQASHGARPNRSQAHRGEPWCADRPVAEVLADAMRVTLRDSLAFAITSPSELIAGVRQAQLGSPLDGWLAYHHDRHGW
jgi:hypothetical protein